MRNSEADLDGGFGGETEEQFASSALKTTQSSDRYEIPTCPDPIQNL